METPIWLSVHLFYAGAVNDLLVQAVLPFCRWALRRGYITDYFFIRYGEGGPHIRLRLRGTADTLTDCVRPVLQRYFANYFRVHPSQRQNEIEGFYPNNSVAYIAYKPETQRYGGPRGVRLAEQLFYISSHVVIERIQEERDWTLESALGIALQMHCAVAAMLNLSTMQAAELFQHAYVEWFDVMGLGTPEQSLLEHVHEQSHALFGDIYQRQEHMLLPYFQSLWERLNSTMDEIPVCWLTAWINDYGPLLSSYNKHLQQYVASERQRSILGALLHMTNNRLGISNRDEVYLSYVLTRLFTRLIPH